MKKKLTYKYTRDINEFGPFLDDLMKDFGPVYLHTVLQWCRIIPSEEDNFWKVWVIKKGRRSIGMCGLYALNHSAEELWLGWLGIHSEHRKHGLGQEVMQHLYKQARREGCVRIMSYVDRERKPLNFYLREGFTVLGTVKDYMRKKRINKMDAETFNNMNDIVIRKNL